MLSRLAAIPGLELTPNAPLKRYTRFALGGPAEALADAPNEAALLGALRELRADTYPYSVIGGGSNIIAPDKGFPGIVLRYTGKRLHIDGDIVHVAAGVMLQDLVDATIAAGLQGLHTMTGIPGWVGGAIYGNAGAYGHSIDEFVRTVRFFDGRSVQEFDYDTCQFGYRESIFKENKDAVILSTTLSMGSGDPAKLREEADAIRKVRDEKYPPAMRCAGSIFKNLFLADLPPSVRAQVPDRVVREGKVAAAFFLEAAGAKGMEQGGIRVANYHANLIYNTGDGTGVQLHAVIDISKRLVAAKFGFELQEEVQYLS